MNKIRRLIATSTAGALVALSCGATYAFAAPTTVTSGGQKITSGQSAKDLATALVGNGVEISDAKYTGDPDSAGLFSGFDSIGVDEGIALATGSLAAEAGANSLLGPNESSGTGGSMGTPGDSELTKIAGDETHDAAVLEFDFTASGSNVQFSYVFGSEEYPEWVDADYNDVFALTVNDKNCALIPGTNSPVTIHNVNEEKNNDYFRKNYTGSGDDAEPATKWKTQLDGLTTVLKCKTKVTPGKTNHIKLAIADTSDSSYDSAVLIKAGSIEVQEPPKAKDATYYYSTEDDAPKVATDLTATDVNTADTLTYSVVDQPKYGTLSGSAKADGSGLVYTPDAPKSGADYKADSFTYKANDGTADSNVATVTVKPNTPPSYKDESYTTKFQTELKVDKGDGVLANESDADAGQTVTVPDYQQPKHGKVSVAKDGSFTYTPDKGFSGKDSFKYSVTDGVDTIDPVATITVKPNDPPVGKADHYKTDYNTKLKVSAPLAGLLKNDSDPDNDKLTTPKHSKPTEGGKVKLAEDGTFRYTPKDGFTGTDTFTYRLSDGYHTSDPIKVTIKVGAPSGAKDSGSNGKDSESTSDQAEPKPGKDKDSGSNGSQAEVKQDDGSVTVTATQPAPPAPKGDLAATGSDVSPTMIGIGIGALVAGLGTVVAARKLRR